MSSQRSGTVSPTRNISESAPLVGNPSSDPPGPSLPNGGASSCSPDKDLDVKISSWVLVKKPEEGQAEAGTGKSYEHAITINMLTDDVLLEIFDSFRKCHNPDTSFHPVWMWHRLVQVCKRWRQLIFASPRHLDLQLLCTNGTPVRENLDCWPPFPIAIHYFSYRNWAPYDKENILALLNQPGRIRHIDLILTGLQLIEVATAMQQPFPVLTHLKLEWTNKRPPAFPSGFLGGSAPCLQYIHLDGIVFPALSTFLLSTSDLVRLILRKIPEEGYISPEVMVACLAVLPKLKTLSIEFQSTSFGRDRIPRTRTLLPSLISFHFVGDHNYLGDLVSRIDSPRLNQITVEYWDRHLHFQVTPLFQFIDRSEELKKSQITHADVNFSRTWLTFEMYPHPERRPGWSFVSGAINCYQTRQASYIAQVFNQASAVVSRVAHLKLYRSEADAGYRFDDWLHLFRQFSAIQTLHISRLLSVHVASILEAVSGEMVAEVLPVLDYIYLADLPVSCVEKFLTARQISGHPVTIIDTEAEFNERVESYFE